MKIYSFASLDRVVYNLGMEQRFLEKRPSETPLVVLDTETTGLYPGLGHRIVEIGAIRLENWQEVGQVSTLIQPGRKMDLKASSVNGISDADLIASLPLVRWQMTCWRCWTAQ